MNFKTNTDFGLAQALYNYFSLPKGQALTFFWNFLSHPDYVNTKNSTFGHLYKFLHHPNPNFQLFLRKKV